MKVRHLLIGVVAATALLAAIANGASPGSTSKVPAGAVTLSANVQDEEMVAGLIVKPHPHRGAKLAHALQSSDARGLTRAANAGMSVFRQMSGGAHVVRLD